VSIEDGACEWGFSPSDEEVEASTWLMKTLGLMCERKGRNAARAEAARRVLIRLAEHQIDLHNRIHELEDVLHSKGFVEVEAELVGRQSRDVN
jgi:hypothetical protein